MKSYEDVAAILRERPIKRGANKGAAYVKRGRTDTCNEVYKRISEGCIVATYWNQTAATWFDDGRIYLNMVDEYVPSAREFMKYGVGVSLGTKVVHGVSQTYVAVLKGDKYKLYHAWNNMLVQPDGTPQNLRPFLGRRVDKAATKALRTNLNEFMNLFILGFVSPRESSIRRFGLPDMVIQNMLDNHDKWEELRDLLYGEGVAKWKHNNYWKPQIIYDERIDDPKAYRSLLMAYLTEYEDFTSDTYEI